MTKAAAITPSVLLSEDVSGVGFGDNETERLDALEQLDILDSPNEEAFDRVTRLARKLFDVPVAIVSFIDGHRQWYKSCLGVDRTEVPRGDSFCRYVMAYGTPLVVPDARLDPRFSQNPYVRAERGVRFYAGFPLRMAEGNNLGTLCLIDFTPREFGPDQLEIMHDLADMVRTELQLRLCADRDSLTAVSTRRAFKEEAGRMVALAIRHRHPLSVISLDLDYFKHTNDALGHAVGDQVLAQTAARCAAVLRESDVLGRLGGEEFSILLPGTDQAGAAQVAEKLRLAIEANEIQLDSKAIKTTASFGVAAIDSSARDIESLLEHADRALYEAKAGGRNRVAVWRSAPADLPVELRRVLKAGQILFNGRSSTIDCTVRWLSDQGAGLDVSAGAGFPKFFYLLIQSDRFREALPDRFLPGTAHRSRVLLTPTAVPAASQADRSAGPANPDEAISATV
jgi:diguanylate cyclase (GGDEF)-like protein